MRHLVLALAFLGLILPATASDTTITYQGQLQDAAGPVTATHEMSFRLFDSESGASQIGSAVDFAAVLVEDGLFQVELDFGSEAFSQGPRYLEVEVAGSVLEPRQPITPAPMALNVLNLPDIEDTLTELSCVTGEIPKWDGSAWVCAEDEDTQFSAGEGLHLSGTSFGLDTEFTDARYWRLGGNSEIDSTNNVLGTTDFLALDIQVDGRRAFRFQPSSASGQEPNLVGGHESNAVLGGSTRGATIAGGGQLADDNANVISGSWGSIGGGLDNLVQGIHGVVSGGASNQALGLGSTIGGGTSNQASGLRSVVSGGFGNHALSLSATVPGGSFNRAEGEYSFAAGLRARALHDQSFVWSGRDSTDSFSSTGTHQFLIAADGGVGINTNSPLATLDVEGDTRLGGAVSIDFSEDNDMPPADGFERPTLYSLGSTDSESLYYGTSNSEDPVVSFRSVRTLFSAVNTLRVHRPLESGSIAQHAHLLVEGRATIEDQFFVNGNSQLDGSLRVGGSVGINTTSPTRMLHMKGNSALTPTMLFESEDAPEDRRVAALFMNVTTGHMSIGRMTDDADSLASTHLQIRSDDGHVGIGRSGGSISHPLHMASGAHVTSGGTWTNSSDADAKTDFKPVSPDEILAGVVQLPITYWEYKNEQGVRHLGPTAQDFAAAFQLGHGDKTISTVDANGVALAAIQALYARQTALETENAELRRLAERNAELEDRLAALEALLIDHGQVAEVSP